MKAKRHLVNGEPARRPARPAARAGDGLYRYVPAPPVYRDADGYPIEDGMSQSIDHQAQTAHWREVLDGHCPDATVASDLPMPYQQGDRSKVLVPDLFVALRAERRKGRQSYRLWENPVPELVIEMLSESTWKADVGSKKRTCQKLGVREYWLFDPEGWGRSVPLIGYRLQGKRYRRIAADAAGRFRSCVLNLDLHVRDGKLRFRDPATGEDLATYREAEDGRMAQKRRADEEMRRAEAAERREASERGVRRAAQHRADVEEHRADAEKRRADAAERELSRLRRQLNSSGGIR